MFDQPNDVIRFHAWTEKILTLRLTEVFDLSRARFNIRIAHVETVVLEVLRRDVLFILQRVVYMVDSMLGTVKLVSPRLSRSASILVHNRRPKCYI